MKSMAVLSYGSRSLAIGMEGSGNFHIGKTEIPLGLAAISAVLFITGFVNLFTKSKRPSRGRFSALSSLGYSRFPNGTWAGSVTGNRKQLDQFRCTGIRS